VQRNSQEWIGNSENSKSAQALLSHNVQLSNSPSSLPVQEGSQAKKQSQERLRSQLPEHLSSKRLHSDDELRCLYVNNKTALTTAKKRKLVELYSYLIGGTIEECEKLTKDRLLELISELVSLSLSTHNLN
jgi:hypothetical protein